MPEYGMILSCQRGNDMAEILTIAVQEISHIGSLILEGIGVIILLVSALRSILCMLKREDSAEIRLSRGISMALEFLLAGEVLHTVTAESLNDLLVLGTILILRAIMTLEIHLEMKQHEKKHADAAESH